MPELEFPKAAITVLSPQKTFWEKATLVHVECHRRQIKGGAIRKSRHWYDLAQLAPTNIGVSALKNRGLLKEVVALKSAFFNASYAHYEKCLTGELRLIPDGEGLTALSNDYAQMQDAGMFSEPPPPFEAVVATLRDLESRINTQS